MSDSRIKVITPVGKHLGQTVGDEKHAQKLQIVMLCFGRMLK